MVCESLLLDQGIVMIKQQVLRLLLIVFVFKAIAELPEVHLNENADFVDREGRILLFHGFNSVYKKPPYFNAQDASKSRLKFYQQWGFNVVRLGVLWSASFPLSPGVLNETYLKAIEWQVDELAASGIYVILDMHQDSLSTMFGSYDAVPLWLLNSFPKPPNIFRYPWPRFDYPTGDWQGYTTYACMMAFQNIYDNRSNAWGHWGDFWVEVAQRFKNRPSVIGYNLMNEPFAGNIYTNPLRAIPGYAGRHNLAPVYDYLVRRIRSVDEKKLIFFEGITWSVLGSSRHDGLAGPGFEHVPGSLDNPDEYRKSVFSYHYYCPLINQANTSHTYSAFNRLVCDTIIMPRMFVAVKGIARGLKSGRFLTEFGICVPDGNPNSINTIECNAVMNAADEELQSWTYWDAQFFDDNEVPIIDQVKPFVRVYPMATAGSPIKLVFDVDKGSAFYAFSSTNLTSDLAKKGNPIAVIFLPVEMHYGGGFIAEVTPRSIRYNVSYKDEHILQLYAPTQGIAEGVIIEVNVNVK